MATSLSSKIVSLYFHFVKKYSDEGWEKVIAKKRNKKEKEPRYPKGINYRLVDNTYGKIFYLNENSSSKYTVFYIHGGVFIRDFSRFHWRFIKKIIRTTDAKFIVPAYKLVPYGTWEDAFNLIIPLYKKYIEEHPGEKIIIMGDSAGGGLSLSLSEHFLKEGIKIPDEIILLSPLMDGSLKTADTKNDPWLTISYRVPVKYYADKLDINDYRISPLFGDINGLKNITLFAGTREMLYQDELLFFEKAKQEESNELIIGQGMNHVYPLLPIKEAKEAIKTIIYKITR